MASGVGHDRHHFCPEFFPDTFICIQRQHPIPRGFLEGAVLLRTITGPVGLEDLVRKSSADFNRAVRASGIQDDDFIGPGRDSRQGLIDFSSFFVMTMTDRVMLQQSPFRAFDSIKQTEAR